MRPQDIPILLKIVSKGSKSWLMKELSNELEISASEVSESLNRSVIAGLLAQDKKRIMKQALMDFLEYGLKYVYPQRPGALLRGFPTAHSAPPLNKVISSNDPYVWPYSEGEVRGQAIEPLHPNLPRACEKDRAFYELIALCDALRVGKVRERKIAIDELNRRIC